MLKVLVDGKAIGEEVVKSTASKDYNFSLAAYVGKEVTIQLQNAAGGPGSGWAWENAFWDLIEIVTEDPPVTATWTSAADDGNPQNPENWACTNANGVAVASALPEDVTVVTIPASCTNSFPAGKGFRAKEVKLPATLGANLDWSGITAPFSGTLDLRGKKLTVSQLTGVATFTDSTNLSGELHVNVAAGTLVNTTVAFTGSLKFVKEGAGTFTASKTGQTYSGGTEVAAGKFLFSSTADEKTNCYAGKAGSTVTVDAGATLDLYGNAGFNTHPLVLAGGTVMSSGTNSKLVQSAQIGNVTLTADSTIDPSQHIRCTGCIDLGTHMITITPPDGKYFSMVAGSSFTNGKVSVTTAGFIHFAVSAVRDMSTVDFRLKCGTDIACNIIVRDLELDSKGVVAPRSSDSNLNSCFIFITGKYMPKVTTGYNRKCELKDGATLDLRYQTAAWPLEPTHLTVENGATVYVDFGTREIANGTQLVSWTTAPTNLSSFKFRLNPGREGFVGVKNDGVYYLRGFRIFVR